MSDTENTEVVEGDEPDVSTEATDSEARETEADDAVESLMAERDAALARVSELETELAQSIAAHQSLAERNAELTAMNFEHMRASGASVDDAGENDSAEDSGVDSLFGEEEEN